MSPSQPYLANHCLHLECGAGVVIQTTLAGSSWCFRCVQLVVCINIRSYCSVEWCLWCADWKTGITSTFSRCCINCFMLQPVRQIFSGDWFEQFTMWGKINSSAKLDAFSINVPRYSQNHKKYIFGPPYGGIGDNTSTLYNGFNPKKLCSRVSSSECQFYS